MHFRNDHVIKNVVIIGSGGTGSRLVPQIVQFIKTVPLFEQLQYPKVYLLDDDIVENKNLTRQLFVKPDVGQNKASVIANRYEKAYNFPIIDIGLKFEDLFQANYEDHPGHEALTRAIHKQRIVKNKEELDTTLDFLLDHQYTVFILCVDSIEARFKIFNMISSMKRPQKYIIIDSGNENTFGQVSTFHLRCFASSHESEDEQITFYNNALEKSVPEAYNTIKDIDTNFIPFPWHLYANRQESEIACADLDQTLAMNSLMASGIMSVFQNITLMKPISVVTTFYNLNGIHTHEPLNFSSFCGASYATKENIENSGLTNSIYVFNDNLPGFTSDQTNLENQANALFSVLNSLLPIRRSTDNDDLDFSLRHNLLLLEAKYYEHYIENSIGFTELNSKIAYFLDFLEDASMIDGLTQHGEYCRFKIVVDAQHLKDLSGKTGEDSLSLTETDPILHISFLVKTLDYLNLIASYLISTGQTRYGYDTYHLFTAGIARGMAIPMMTPRICEFSEISIRGPRPDHINLVIRDIRFERMSSPFTEGINTTVLMNTNYVKSLNHFFGYLDKFINKRYSGDYRQFFTRGSVYICDYFQPEIDTTITPVDFTLTDTDYPEFEQTLFQSMEYLFNRLRSEKSSAVLADPSLTREPWPESESVY